MHHLVANGSAVQKKSTRKNKHTNEKQNKQKITDMAIPTYPPPPAPILLRTTNNTNWVGTQKGHSTSFKAFRSKARDTHSDPMHLLRRSFDLTAVNRRRRGRRWRRKREKGGEKGGGGRAGEEGGKKRRKGEEKKKKKKEEEEEEEEENKKKNNDKGEKKKKKMEEEEEEEEEEVAEQAEEEKKREEEEQQHEQGEHERAGSKRTKEANKKTCLNQLQRNTCIFSVSNFN